MYKVAPTPPGRGIESSCGKKIKWGRREGKRQEGRRKGEGKRKEGKGKGRGKKGKVMEGEEKGKNEGIRNGEWESG